METGELPGLSGDSGSCAAELKPFNPDGNGGSTIGNSGGSGSGSGQNGDGDGSGRNSKTAANRRGAGTERGQLDSNSGSSSRAEGAGGSVGGMKSASDFFNRKGRKQTSVVGEVKDEKNYTGSTKSGKKPRMVGLLPAPVEETRTTLDRRFVAEPDAKEEKEPPQQTSAPEGSSFIVKGKKISYNVKRETAAAKEEKEGFSIGALLRFLLIAAIIIALGMLLLGQGVQISKSWEK